MKESNHTEHGFTQSIGAFDAAGRLLPENVAVFKQLPR